MEHATSTRTFAQFVEASFGSDAALNIEFELIDGRRISLEEGDAVFAALGNKCPDLVSVFADGTSATVCTNYAAHVFRALPGRVAIFGFANKDNPSSRAAREEFHPEGHDFAVVDERFLVDPWVRLVAGVSQQMCFDFHDRRDAALVLDTYGPRACWERLDEAEQSISSKKATMPTQQQFFYQAQRNIGGTNELLMELVREGMTREELARNIERRPSLWERYGGFLDVLPSSATQPIAA